MRLRALACALTGALATMLAGGCVHGSPPSPPAAALGTMIDEQASALSPGTGLVLRVEAPPLNLAWAQARGDSADPAQAFRIASVTKTFVAAAVLRLVENGRLDLNAPIEPYLPADLADLLKSDGYDLSRMTVRMLLGHTAGLYDYAEDPAFQSRVMNEPGHVWSRKEQVAFAVEHGDPIAAPGERFAYSDTGYILLGSIIETVAGQTMAEAVRALLDFERLGLAATWFEDLESAPAKAPGRAQQRIGAFDVLSIDASADLFGGGGLISTTSDLTRFFQALLQGDVLREPSLAAMMQPSAQSQAAGQEGYGMGLNLHTVNGVDCFGHGGFWGVLVWSCPSRDLTVAGFVTNTTERAVLTDATEAALHNLIAAGGE